MAWNPYGTAPSPQNTAEFFLDPADVSGADFYTADQGPAKQEKGTWEVLLDFLKGISGGNKSPAGGPVGATGGPAMAYVPPLGKVAVWT